MQYDMKDVKRKFYTQRSGAKARGIEFKMTFDEWWEVWKPHWANRGSKKGQLVMCRKMDCGAYEVGNVRIGTVDCNARDRSYTCHDRWMKAAQEEVRQAQSGEYEEEEDENSWLPDELKNPYRSSADFRY
jgi:hypothetical protein